MNMRYLIFFLLFIGNISSKSVLISPGGDSKKIGRYVLGGTERASALQFSEMLAQEIIDNNMNALLSRRAGQEMSEFQIVGLTNKLNPDLFIAIHVCKIDAIKPKLSVYTLSYNNMEQQTNSEEFVSLNKAHLKNKNKSFDIAKQVQTYLSQQENRRIVDTDKPFSLPLRILCGIMPPAILLEIGISQEEKLKSLVKPVSLAILSAL